MPEPIYGTDTITNTDLVRQLWLDNDFYGSVFSLQYKTDKSQLTFGGGWNRYEGNHYGDVVWAEKGLTLPARWYDLDANKNDLTLYFKQQAKISSLVSVFYDLQYRGVKYDLYGFQDNPGIIIKNNYNFFNPKAGLSFQKNEWSGYFSIQEQIFLIAIGWGLN